MDGIRVLVSKGVAGLIVSNVALPGKSYDNQQRVRLVRRVHLRVI